MAYADEVFLTEADLYLMIGQREAQAELLRRRLQLAQDRITTLEQENLDV